MKLWLFPVVIVVICSHFSIFETLETTVFSLNAAKAKLWFALILVSLKHWKQHMAKYICPTAQLWFALILVSLKHWKQHTNTKWIEQVVVICSHFSIFETLETTRQPPFTKTAMLWFALILVSLKHWKQRCAFITILFPCCDLLSF